MSHRTTVDAFRVDRYPITNREFRDETFQFGNCSQRSLASGLAGGLATGLLAASWRTGDETMSSMAIAWIVFACVFAGALLGMFFRSVLSEQHLSGETKDVVKVAIALIATMAALVLSLLISSAKSAYDARNSELVQMSANLLLLDRMLAHYGPDTKDTRSLLRNSLAAAIERYWPADGAARPADFKPTASPFEAIYDQIQQLSPENDYQRSLKSQALTTTTDLGHTRFLLFEGFGSSIPLPFLVVMVFWLTIIFASFGLFAPPNAIVTSVFAVCALSVSGALFLILELDRSYTGMIQVSSAPLRQALARLGQ